MNQNQRRIDQNFEEVIETPPIVNIEKKNGAVEVTYTFTKTYTLEEYQKKIVAAEAKIAQLQKRILDETERKGVLSEVLK